MRLGRRRRDPPQAARRESCERLGGGEDPVFPDAPRAPRRSCRPLRAAKYLNFVSFDSHYSNGWDMASALHPQTILAYAMNDNPLAPGHGAPLRLYSPTKLGYKMTKYLLSMTFTDRRPGGYWEDQGYPGFGGI